MLCEVTIEWEAVNLAIFSRLKWILLKCFFFFFTFFLRTPDALLQIVYISSASPRVTVSWIGKNYRCISHVFIVLFTSGFLYIFLKCVNTIFLKFLRLKDKKYVNTEALSNDTMCVNLLVLAERQQQFSPINVSAL